MSLSCSCGEWNGDGWSWRCENDFTILKGARRKRCCSCKELINIGAECVELERLRYPITEVEERIYGEEGEINIASWYLCERCGEIYLNLDALGYCYNIGDDLREDLREYHQMTGFVPQENCQAA